MTPVVEICCPFPNFATAMYMAGTIARRGYKVKVFKVGGRSWVI